MKNFFGILVLFLFFYNPSSFAVIKGKGEVKLTDRAVNHFIYYIRCEWPQSKKIPGCKPSLFILSSNGDWNFTYYCAYNQCQSNEKKMVERCERETGVSCGTFALRRTIYWENGINTKENKAKFKKKWSGHKIKDELARLGFYGETTSNTTSSTGKDIVEEIKKLKKLYEDGIITKEEFTKAKKKILN